MKSIPFEPAFFHVFGGALRHGEILILPTDTIPGFATDATNQKGIANIFRCKNRPEAKALLLLVPDFLSAEKVAVFSPLARKLARTFWPGPLTLLLPRKKGVLSHFFPESLELAIRVPGDALVRSFLHFFGKPIASTSVNISGSLPLVSSEEILSIFGKEEGILASHSKDPQKHSIFPSTIVRVGADGVTCIRSGVIPEHEIQKSQQK
ncbi:L-threonylcarbamoyladenylate synthase [Candidatus Peregrinibacteria bacterium]|nr:MAG: L-threonylcarbamoyladenylate synthase [Candidatus Peregrinibacteria bacterium]